MPALNTLLSKILRGNSDEIFKPRQYKPPPDYLPEDKISKILRSQEQGYDDRTFYHGTLADEDFPAFDLDKSDIGVHVGTRGQASDRLQHFVRRENVDRRRLGEEPLGYLPNSRVIPLKARLGNQLRLPDIGDWDDAFSVADVLDSQPDVDVYDIIEKYSQKLDEIMGNTTPQYSGNAYKEFRGQGLNLEMMDELRARLKEAGYDSIIYMNEAEFGPSGRPLDSHIILDPGRLRSPEADFDPKKIGVNDLMALKSQALRNRRMT